MEFKAVIGAKDGKSYQKAVKGNEAEALLKKSIGDKVSGEELGFAGYEFLITGGSDNCGFPMRKGIVFLRKKIMTGKGVGFSGKDRNKKNQPGLLKKRTVCGEAITKSISQVNLKVLKEGPHPFVDASEKQEAPKKE